MTTDDGLKAIIERMNAEGVDIPLSTLRLIRAFSVYTPTVPLPEPSLEEAYWLGAVFGYRLRDYE